MNITAATSITTNADPTDAPTMIAVESKAPDVAGITGTQAAADMLPDDDVVCNSGQGVQVVEALEVE